MSTLTRTYLSDLSQLAAMREFVGESCRKAWTRAADERAIRQLQLALQEAAVNVIEHAYQNRAGRPIELTLEAREDQVCVTLAHDGLPFDPANAAAPDFSGAKEGGFGVYMMEQLTDEVVYSQEADGRCRVRLVKNRVPRDQE